MQTSHFEATPYAHTENQCHQSCHCSPNTLLLNSCRKANMFAFYTYPHSAQSTLIHVHLFRNSHEEMCNFKWEWRRTGVDGDSFELIRNDSLAFAGARVFSKDFVQPFNHSWCLAVRIPRSQCREFYFSARRFVQLIPADFLPLCVCVCGGMEQEAVDWHSILGQVFHCREDSSSLDKIRLQFLHYCGKWALLVDILVVLFSRKITSESYIIQLYLHFNPDMTEFVRS